MNEVIPLLILTPLLWASLAFLPGPAYLQLAGTAGIAPELLHRVAAIATGGLDSLPHNGAVITLLSICGLGRRQAYPDIFMVAVIGPIIALVVVVTLGTLLGSF